MKRTLDESLADFEKSKAELIKSIGELPITHWIIRNWKMVIIAWFVFVVIAVATSCTNEEPIQIKPYTFAAFKEDHLLKIRYQSNLPGYRITVSDSDRYDNALTQAFWSETSTGCGELSTSLYWGTTYLMLETSEYREEIIVQ